MLNALGYDAKNARSISQSANNNDFIFNSADESIFNSSPENKKLKATKKILDRFKLFGLILHDPEIHSEFHETLKKSFEKLDYLTGRDFLFFALTDPPKSWEDRNVKRDYFEIWEPEKLLSPMNAYRTKDESISTYSLAQALNIDFDDLPVIILTNNFQFNQFRVIKTCSRQLSNQMAEIGYFSSKTEKSIDINSDRDFNLMIRNIDQCGGNYMVNSEESLAMTLSDFLAFVVAENGHSDDKVMAETQIRKVVMKFLDSKHLVKDSDRTDQMNLFMMGCLSNLCNSATKEEIEIDERCEYDSKIILKTFNNLYPYFNSINKERRSSPHRLFIESNQLFASFSNLLEIDYSPLIMSLCKIFEIEVNLSIVHWFRNHLNIEMPQYFKKYKNDSKAYTIMPESEFIRDPHPVNFNKGLRGKWIAPGLGESQIVTQYFYTQGKLPSAINDYKTLLTNWEIFRQYRNSAAHTEWLKSNDLDVVVDTFKNITSSSLLSQINDLKLTFKQ